MTHTRPARIRLASAAAPAAAVLWLLQGCVNLTPPWEKVTAADANGGAGTTDGPVVPDEPARADGEPDVGVGGVIDSDRGGAGGALDAPATGPGGALDADQGGAGGALIDGPGVGAGGAGGSPDVGADVPLGGAGGAGSGGRPGTGGTARTGGASGKGGASGGGGSSRSGGATGAGGKPGTGGTGTGGASASGGAPGTGGASASGGAPSTGGVTTPDAGPDVQPDTSTLGNGLLAYYPCESANGSSLEDVSSHGNHATLSASGSYSFAAGPKAGLGNALTLTRSNSGYVAMPPAMFRGLTQITIATWVKIGSAVDWQRLFDIGVNAGLSQNPVTGTNTVAYMNFVAQGYQGGPGLFGITKSGYANEQRLIWTSALPSEWHHLAIVLSGSTGALYVDGGPPTVNNAMTLRPADLGTIDYAFIGRSQFSVDPYFDGSIDELRVYNRALSASEIQALYALSAP